MSPNPFDPTFDQLPEIVPIFPLTGVLLLPRGKLPLNVFEPRYLAMTEDALSGNRMIGIIQPSDPLSRASVPPVYPIGCAGRITSFSETDDGRYLITLTGVCRFETVRELPIVRGYRRVDVSWERFAADLEERATSAMKSFRHGGGRAEARNVVRALRAARGMRQHPPTSVD